jgi:hypothetical protein
VFPFDIELSHVGMQTVYRTVLPSIRRAGHFAVDRVAEVFAGDAGTLTRFSPKRLLFPRWPVRMIVAFACLFVACGVEKDAPAKKQAASPRAAGPAAPSNAAKKLFAGETFSLEDIGHASEKQSTLRINNADAQNEARSALSMAVQQLVIDCARANRTEWTKTGIMSVRVSVAGGDANEPGVEFYGKRGWYSARGPVADCIVAGFGPLPAKHLEPVTYTFPFNHRVFESE